MNLKQVDNPYAKPRPTPSIGRPVPVPVRSNGIGQAMRDELTKQTHMAARAMRDLSNTYRTNNTTVSKQYPATPQRESSRYNGG